MTVSPEVLDLCAGPGGWDEAIRSLSSDLHDRTLGIEWDDDAVATRDAAGHRTLKADIAATVLAPFRGARGLIASPPCTLFSQAGSGVGRDVIDLLVAAVYRLLDGDDCREDVRRAVYPVTLNRLVEENRERATPDRWSPERIERRARDEAYVATLAVEPARYLAELGAVSWCAFEQVPHVLPLWRHYRNALRRRGWSAWAGLLNAADYGVPQTRERAFLIARREGVATPPVPTHADGGSTADLFGDERSPWVTMADALGWEQPIPSDRINDQTGTAVDLSWPWKRPATTVATRLLIPHPGSNANRFNGATKSRNDGIRVTVEEASALQSFRVDYPWRGTRPAIQIGNAVPPLLARAVFSRPSSI